MIVSLTSASKGILLGGLLTFSSAYGAENKKPDIIMIISDDQRFDLMGASGNGSAHTPAMDRLAQIGVRFQYCLSAIPQCSPSRACLLTGIMGHQSGWLGNGAQLPEVDTPDGFKNFSTFPAELKKIGYSTHHIGKWHVTPTPESCGFDSSSLMVGAMMPYKDKDGRFINSAMADEVVQILESPQSATKPQFIWVGLTAPHIPLLPVPDECSKPYAEMDLQALIPFGYSTKHPNSRAGKIEDWKNYYSAVTHADQAVGRILSSLEERKRLDSTIVVFFSDNGHMMGSRGLPPKASPYRESVLVPCIVHVPKGKGMVVDAPISTLDIPPTLVSLAGGEIPSTWHGRNLAPALSGMEPWPEEAISEFPVEKGRREENINRCILAEGKWLILRPNGSHEMYDEVADPQQLKNLYMDSGQSNARVRLENRLRKWFVKTSDPALGWIK